MKTLRPVLLACTLLLPLTAHADDPYVKLGVGWSRYDFGSLFGEKLINNETGFSIAYGAKYDKVLGLEVGYVDFGRVRHGIEDSNGNPSTYKAQALYLAGTGSMALTTQAELLGKLGLTANHHRGPQESGTRTRVMAGVGGMWHFTKEWGTSLEYTYFGESAGVSLTLLSLSAVYKF